MAKTIVFTIVMVKPNKQFNNIWISKLSSWLSVIVLTAYNLHIGFVNKQIIQFCFTQQINSC